MKAFANSSLLAYSLIAVLFLATGAFFVIGDITPAHDVLTGGVIFHLLYKSLARGVIPFWNAYDQTGTPYYPTYQFIGLWEPSNYPFILFQRMTGCCTMTTYLFHYLFDYFIFIAGAYTALRVIVKRNDTCLLFSLILLLGTFSWFMYEPGPLLLFYLVPFILASLLSFFEESAVDKRGLQLFIAVSLSAMACLSYIPAGVVFFVVFFLFSAVVLGIAKKENLATFAASRRGLLWIGACGLTALLIAAPLLALHHDMAVDNELFPYIRLMIHAQFHPPKVFASDIGQALLSAATMLRTPESMTWGSMVGLILAPWPYVMRLMPLWVSGNIIYLGILPLLCVFVFVRKMREIDNKYAELSLMICVATILIMFNFGSEYQDPPSVFQRFLTAVIPIQNRYETFFIYGGLFVFCLTIVAAAGFKRLVDGKSRGIFLAALGLTTLKYILSFPFTFKDITLSTLRGLIPWPGLRDNSIMWIYIVSVSLLGVWPVRRVLALSFKKLQALSIAMLLADLLFVIAVQIHDGNVLNKKAYDIFRRESAFGDKAGEFFLDYRFPFEESTQDSLPGQSPAPLSGEKLALPATFRLLIGEGPNQVDNLFSTNSYYDYISNVRLDKQLAASGVTRPILDFYPLRDVIFVQDAHEAVRRMNALDVKTLGRTIFIERSAEGRPTATSAATDYVRLFSPENRVNPSRQEIESFQREKTRQYPAQPDFYVRVTGFDANTLSAVAEAPKDGYFYFSDGYSKHWRAFLDGRETHIEKTNVNFKSIFMPKGKHVVAFVYDPILIRYAIYASFAGSIMAVALAVGWTILSYAAV